MCVVSLFLNCLHYIDNIILVKLQVCSDFVHNILMLYWELAGADGAADLGEEDSYSMTSVGREVQLTVFRVDGRHDLGIY